MTPRDSDQTPTNMPIPALFNIDIAALAPKTTGKKYSKFSRKRLFEIDFAGLVFYGPCLVHICEYISANIPGMQVKPRRMMDIMSATTTNGRVYRGMTAKRTFPASAEDWTRAACGENKIFVP